MTQSRVGDDKSFTTSNQQWQAAVTYALFIKWFFIIILIIAKKNSWDFFLCGISKRKLYMKEVWVAWEGVHVYYEWTEKNESILRNCLHHGNIIFAFMWDGFWGNEWLKMLLVEKVEEIRICFFKEIVINVFNYCYIVAGYTLKALDLYYLK